MNSKIPNILTLTRLASVPLFSLFLFVDSIQYRLIFLALFVYASITDFLDGYLARKYNINTTFGRVFDPIADKSLILVVFIVLLVKNISYAPYIVIPIMVILLRELVISGIREGLAVKQIIVNVSKLGKYKTTIQMICLGFLILGGKENIYLVYIEYIGIVLTYLSMIISFISGLDYIIKVYKDLLSNE